MGPPTSRYGHRTDRRILIALSAAMLLPVLIYALITIGVNYRDNRQAVERETSTTAQRVSAAVDNRLAITAATMRALATARSIAGRDWAEAYGRAGEIARLDPDWRSVALIDLDAGVELFDLRRPFGAMPLVDRAAVRDLAAGSRTEPRFSGVVKGVDGRPEIQALLPIDRPGRHYLLRVSLDPALVQRALLHSAPADQLSAIVDRSGLFIARTKAWPERLGTPGTRYVLAAIKQRSGLYRGVTWEGMTNYTAFTTSPRTGWSTHVAVPSLLIDRPQSRGLLASLLAGLSALAFAVLIIFLILRANAVAQTAQRRAHQAERLEAIGKLTGGIAHDFNNMLAIIIGSLDLAEHRMATGDSNIARYLKAAREGADRATQLTRRLLVFSRGQSLTPAAVDANAVIRGMSELLHRTLTSDIAIELALAPDLWPVFADAAQLENALINLAVNARDAMPDGGRLIIASENRASGGVERVAIAVRDTGVGMTPQVAAHAFDPFYTTKPPGQGTGLGLSQIHGFARHSGGDAIIETGPGEGTTVTILLPRHCPTTAEPTASAPATTGEPLPRAVAGETILLVDDDDRLRVVHADLLHSLGYAVHEAANGEEALALLAREAKIDLLLTDIVMPGINGRELARRARLARPGIPVLLVTGFEPDGAASDAHPLLRKPFRMKELARHVRMLLDGAAAATTDSALA